MQPSAAKPTESPIYVWRFFGLDRPVVLWSFACHPTGFFEPATMTSEYPGLVREAIRAALGDSSVVIFLPGASGDLRQPFMSRSTKRLGLAQTILNINPRLLPAYVRPSADEWHSWASTLAETVKDCVQTTEPKAIDKSAEIRAATRNIDQFLDGIHPVESVSAAHVKVGSDLKLVFINAEVTSQLAQETLTLAMTDAVLVSCANQCIGYLASAEEIDEGGYESCTWPHHFGCESSVRSDAPERFMELVQSVISPADA